MTAKGVSVSQRGLLILIAFGLLASGVAVYLGHTSPQTDLRAEPILLSDVTVIAPVFRARQPIDVNVASANELEALPGIGPALAGRILAYRREHGSFATLDDLVEVDGIGLQTVEGLRAHATAGGGDTSDATQ